MPELPEVETIRLGLAPHLTGRSIIRAEVRNAGSVRPDPDTFLARVAAAPIRSVQRRAKLLLIALGDPDQTDPVCWLAFHLKMTGKLLIQPPEAAPNKHTHVVFHLDDGRQFFFEDMRKFGFAAAFTPEELQSWPFYASLGPEPLDIGREAFLARFRSRAGRIKSLLLDQTVIAGIGNIYADEALFAAHIHPAVQARTLTPDQLSALHESVQAILRRSIALGGSSIRDYRLADGSLGRFQATFNAYGRQGQPCPACGAQMASAKVAGRTSTYCPCCQPVAEK